MAIKQIVTIGPLEAGVANYYVASVTPTTGQSLTLAETTTPDVARRVLATYGDEGSARTLALTGTDRYGNTISETLAIPAGVSGGGTVYSLQDFETLTSVVAGGGAWTTNVTVGTNSVASSPWKNVSAHVTPTEMGINCVINGTVNYTVEYTNDSLNPANPTSAAGAPQGPSGPVMPIPTPFPLPALTGQTANGSGKVAQEIEAWRITLNSGSGSVTATGIAGGIIQGH